MKKSFSPLTQTATRFILLAAVFAISILVGSLYTGGDQRNYGFVYDVIGALPLVDAFAFYTRSLTSIEVVHFIFIWSLSSYFPKVLLFSIVNTIFAGLIVRLFDLIKVNFLITCVFLLSNFYIYVLFFAAERLKFGFLLLILGLSIQSGKVLKNSMFLLSLSAHFQMVLVLAPKAFEMFIATLVRALKVRRFNLTILILLVPFLFLPLVSDFLLEKLQNYEDSRSIVDYAKVACFLILALWYAGKKSATSVLIMFVPIFIAVYFVGGDRVNMIAYFYFLAYGLTYRNGLNIGILLTTLYFLIKTIFFIQSIINVGHGFS